MKLTKALRHQILLSVLGATNFEERKAAIIKESNDLMRELLRAALPENFEESVKNLPPEWFSRVTQWYPDNNPASELEYMKVEYDESTNRSSYKNCLTFPYLVSPFGSPKVNTKPLDPLYKKAGSLLNEYFETKKQLRDLLLGFTTTDKLLAACPEFERHVPYSSKSYPLTVSVIPTFVALKKAGFDTTAPVVNPVKKPSTKKKETK